MKIAPRAATFAPGSVVFPLWLLGDSVAGLVPGVVLAHNDTRAWTTRLPRYVSNTREAIDAYVIDSMGRGFLWDEVPVHFGQGRVEWVRTARLQRYSEHLREKVLASHDSLREAA